MNDRTASSTPLRLLGPSRSPSGETRRPTCAASDDPQAPRPTPPLLDEPSLFYDPPYASRLHDEFAWHLVKYLKPGSGLRYQVEEPALDALALSIDFVVERGPLRVGFMCGASEAGVEQDRLLDAVRIRHAPLDALYRLRAGDLERHLHDTLLLVAKWDAVLFSDRGHTNLNTLATPEARAARPRVTDTIVTLRYGTEDGPAAALPSASLRVQRLSRAHPDGWMPAYEQAREHFGITEPPQHWARSA